MISRDIISLRRIREGVVFLVESIFFLVVSFCCFGAGIIATEANVPPATGIVLTITKIDSKGTSSPYDDEWIEKVSSFDFGELKQVSGYTEGKKWTLFLPRYYFAVDIGLTGGGFDPTKSTIPPSTLLRLIISFILSLLSLIILSPVKP